MRKGIDLGTFTRALSYVSEARLGGGGEWGLCQLRPQSIEQLVSQFAFYEIVLNYCSEADSVEQQRLPPLVKEKASTPSLDAN